MFAVEVLLCVILLLLGAALLLLGFRGLRGTLPRNRYAGVRTPAAMRSEETFELANRAAGPAMLAAGAVAVLAGVSMPMLTAVFSVVLVAVLGFAGAVALMIVGGVAGNRAAELMPDPEPAFGGCAGCACGGCGS